MSRIIKKFRGGIKCLREHGFVYTAKLVFKEIAKKILPASFILLNKKFKENILCGFNTYSKLIEKYGSNTQIYKTSGGTGDVYIAGLYFKEYLKVNNINRKPVFTVIRQGGYEVAELFDLDNIELISYMDRKSMVHFGIFVGFDNINFTIIHHNPRSLYTSVLGHMEGIHKMCSCDVLKYTIYDGIIPTSEPKFDYNIAVIKKMFADHKLKRRKTVLLAPYSVSMQSIPLVFWEKLVKELKIAGYSVCTNSQDENEPAIKGTMAINIPIKYIVPFLNESGYLVGARSGIIDVTAMANIKNIDKIISDIILEFSNEGV